MERETPAEAAACDEIVMLALRLSSGLRLEDYPGETRDALAHRYGAAFTAAHAAGRLEAVPGGWRVPRAHRFLADDTIAWVAARARG
ncbi:MAG: hypothetical protein U0704_09435 [Candidatus Eisenbacteria bacterium]